MYAAYVHWGMVPCWEVVGGQKLGVGLIAAARRGKKKKRKKQLQLHRRTMKLG